MGIPWRFEPFDSFCEFLNKCFSGDLYKERAMSSGLSNRTGDNTSQNAEGSSSSLPISECLPWIVLLITESLVIVVLNAITMAVFMTQRQMQRRRTYILIRNLTICDFLAGAISGALQVERIGDSCDCWEFREDPKSWTFLLKFAFLHVFSFASLANLVAISLERVHATYHPSRHLFMKRRAYYIAVAIIWLVAITREALQSVLVLSHEGERLENIILISNITLYVVYYLVSLLIVCISYLSIFIKVRFGPRVNPMNHAVIIRERRLSAILFAVSVASLITLLPVSLFLFLNWLSDDFRSLGESVRFHIKMIVTTFFVANSLVNPVIYAMRMQGFRAGVANLFCATGAKAKRADIPLPKL